MSNQEFVNGIAVELTGKKARGGQAVVHFGRLAKAPTVKVVIKFLKNTPAARKRVQAQFESNLTTISPYFHPALTYEIGSKHIKLLCLEAKGKDFRNDRSRNLIERLACGHMMAANFASYEAAGLAYGDWHWENVLFDHEGRVSIIDQDNINYPNPEVPPPPMLGHKYFKAPELNLSGARPDQFSDRFGFGVLTSTVLLGRHPTQGLAKTEKEVTRLLGSGRNPETSRHDEQGMVPYEALGQNLIGLIENSFSLRPELRMPAKRWLEAYTNAWARLYKHNCGQVFVLDSHISGHCPWCKQRVLLPTTYSGKLYLELSNSGQKFRTDLSHFNHEFFVGGSNLPIEDKRVSSRHLKIQTCPLDLKFENVGRNQVFVEYRGRISPVTTFSIALHELERRPLKLWLYKEPIELSYRPQY